MLQKDSEIFIRQMQIDDVAKVADIEKECFADPWSEKAFVAEIGKVGAITLVAVLNGEIVGFVNGYLVLDEMYINNIAVTEKFRRNKIGYALLKNLENIVNEIASFISLEVRISNHSAIKFYQENGFEKISMRKKFYENPVEDAVIMTKLI